jgi:hypothetical protein
MALTTRAKVLLQLGLTDDATAFSALAVTLKGATLTACTFAVNAGQTTLTITPTPGSPTVLTLTDAAYDTMSEVATAISAISGLQAAVASGVANSTASTLLTASQSVTINTTTEVGQLTYTNATYATSASYIDQCILDVQDAAYRWCNRDLTLGFATGTFTETYDGHGSPWIQLKNPPITSITSVSVLAGDGTSTTVDSQTYRVDLTTGVLYRTNGDYLLAGTGTGVYGGGWDGSNGVNSQPAYYRGFSNQWPDGFQNVVVVYVGGYATIPNDLERAARQAVCDLFINRRANRLITGESNNGRTVQYADANQLIERNASLWSQFRPVPA